MPEYKTSDQSYEHRPGDNLIVELWDQGVSASEIGRRAGRSKNAIVGRAHRLMALGLLEPRESPIIRDPDAAPRAPRPQRVTGPTLPPLPSGLQPPPAPRPAPAIRVPRPIAPRPMIVDFRAAVPRPVAAVAVKKYGRVVECCWPIGEPGTAAFRFCEEPSSPSRNYCEAHMKIAYVRVRDLREDGFLTQTGD